MHAGIHQLPVHTGAMDDDGAAALFQHLRARYPHAPMAFLDSADHGCTPRPERSQYSILAFDLREDPQPVHIVGRQEILNWWEQRWVPLPNPVNQQPSFQLGWLGVWGYEDQAMLFEADAAVVLDHHSGQIYAQRRGSWKQAQQWAQQVGAAAAAAETLAAVPLALSRLQARDTREQYLQAIAQAQYEIYQGRSYEICLTTAVTGDAIGDPWSAYVALRSGNRAPFMQFLRFPATGAQPETVLLSASPERFLSVSSQGRVLSEPIKGTRARACDAEADTAAREDLRTHPKDRAENVMIADLVRNDLSIHAEPGTLRTERLCAVESYPTVHQMVSSISAELPPGSSPAQAVGAAFPPGSMTGAPKISTMGILEELETAERGFYSGVAGYLSTTGAADFAVLIRTAVLTRHSTETVWQLHLGLGGAITADSDPEAEWAEVVTKSRGVLGSWGAEFPHTNSRC